MLVAKNCEFHPDSVPSVPAINATVGRFGSGTQIALVCSGREAGDGTKLGPPSVSGAPPTSQLGYSGTTGIALLR